ncbi:MAG: amidohydrolase family protein [Alphaproteobacteria bacterium]|nr:amidohydrolase family protein [Alphaproteobacteria bacterium]
MSKSGQEHGSAAPYCAPPDPELRAPAVPMGPLSCDCHAHICGPVAAYAYADERIYTPPDALPPAYLELRQTLGVARAVLVQPSVYGTDNTVMLEALREMAAAGLQCRGVAVVDATVTEAELEAMHEAGVRGLRFNLVDLADPGKGPPLEAIRASCERIAPRGWHAEFLIHVDDYPDFDARFGDFPTDIVIGHMGYLRPGQDATSDGFAGMLRLAASGRCWVKLTAPYRISAGDLPYAEAGAFARAVVAAAPGRVVWGTDWPHVMVSKPMPNDADLCDLLFQWVPNPAARRRILVDNPAALYDF